MSQYPPATTPPPGYNPGMPSGAPQRGRTSAAAVTSLVCGILGCVPVLTQILALIFGIVGIRATSKPNVTGRGMAIAGIILALLGLAGWGVFGGAIGFAYLKGKPARIVARQYIEDLSSGNVQAAEAESVTGTPKSTVQELSNTVKGYGTLLDITIITSQIDASSGQQTRYKVVAVAKFSSAPKVAEIDIVKEGDAFRVESASFK